MHGQLNQQLSFGDRFIGPQAFELDDELKRVDELLSERLAFGELTGPSGDANVELFSSSSGLAPIVGPNPNGLLSHPAVTAFPSQPVTRRRFSRLLLSCFCSLLPLSHLRSVVGSVPRT